jgi:hypothetical protein
MEALKSFAGRADYCGMTTIRTTCPKCGAVEMGIDAVLLSVREDFADGSYRFLCPGCLATVEKPADQKIISLLLSVGVDVEGMGGELEFEDEAPEVEAQPGSRPPGDPFTIDDLITFHFLLQDDERLARALADS